MEHNGTWNDGMMEHDGQEYRTTPITVTKTSAKSQH
jgi:hypothetical protein